MSHYPQLSELEAFMEANPEIRFMELLVADMNGMLRGKRASEGEFKKPFKNGVNFCLSTVVMNSIGEAFDSVTYGWRDGDPDCKATVVPGTLAPVPWASGPTAQALVEMVTLDGEPQFVDPRNVLRRALKPLTEMGLKPVMATELEFYLVRHNGQDFEPHAPLVAGSDIPIAGAQYGVTDDLYEVEEFLDDVDRFCQAQNIPAGAALSEYSPGQFEINLNHVDDPVLACDHAVLLKRLIKAAARKNGLAATFMAKPFPDIAGSGMHIHVSVLDENGNNVFAGECADGPFSDTLRHAIGGLAAVMPESMAILAPNANSYRRYAPESYVPCTPNWGPNHRGLALRIPLSEGRNTRVEHRVAGADANPYLVVASVVAGIHHGIAQQSDPGPMVPAGTELEYASTLPDRWPLALEAFDRGEILPRYIGQRYHQLYSACRREEEADFNALIPNFDHQWYLRSV